MLDDNERVFEDRAVVLAESIDLVSQREQSTRLLDLDFALVGVSPGVDLGFERRAPAGVSERVLGCCDSFEQAGRVTHRR